MTLNGCIERETDTHNLKERFMVGHICRVYQAMNGYHCHTQPLYRHDDLCGMRLERLYPCSQRL